MPGLINVDAGSTLKDAGSLINSVGNFAGQIRTAITGEVPPEQKLKQVEDILAAIQAEDTGADSINVEEAKSTNWFVAGWRPFVGWICAVGFAWCVIVYPLVLWVCSIWAPSVKIPAPDSGLIIPTLGGMLGIGTMRTVEKIQGIQGNH